MSILLRMTRYTSGLGLALFVLAQSALPARAATVPSGFTDSTVASGLASPTAMEIAPDGRIFVSQQAGALRVIKNGALLPTPFLSLSVNSTGERGLLGVAFDPAFASNRFVYVYYTTSAAPIHNRVSRFTASAANPDVVQAGSELILLELENLSATNHNGGAIHFGADGKLYVAAGENAVGSNSQSLTNLLGKIMRINADGTIPTDNPFYATAAGKNRAIWARGLRNPFTFAFQPGTGTMFINDVGQSTWEEINLGVAGANYGWPTVEGPTNCASNGFSCPVYSYDHAQGCAITGGVFYNPASPGFPSIYTGKYFFAEYCGNWIKSIDPAAPPATNAAAAFATGISAPVDLRVGADGSLYYLARGSGSVGRIQYTAGQPPAITQQPVNQTVPVGGSATFTVSASGSAPLAYQWQVNHAELAGANAATLTVPNVQPGDSGAQFRCQVRNDFGAVFSNDAVLTVTPNTAPVGSIGWPAVDAHYNAGQTVTYSATATDVQDGALPASAFTWQVDFHHATHVHPFLQPVTGATSGSFVVPVTGETAPDVWYRIILTVRDAGGLTHTSFRDVRPNLSTLTLASLPTGLQLTLDGQPVTTPVQVTSVVGMQRTLGVVTPQDARGATWRFVGWSDAGGPVHAVSTRAQNTVYTATFSNGPAASPARAMPVGPGANERASTRGKASTRPD